MTAISIHNRADDPLKIERIMLPVGNLSLYTRGDGRLWTDDVVMRREPSDTSTTVEVTLQQSAQTGVDQVIVAEPREKVVDRGLGRVFESLFG